VAATSARDDFGVALGTALLAVPDIAVGRSSGHTSMAPPASSSGHSFSSPSSATSDFPYRDA